MGNRKRPEPRLIAYAMEAKANPTKSEAALWEGLRKGELGVPFVQQEIIGKYRVDFFCDRAMLVVELDGGYHRHPRSLAYDEKRDAWLRRQGFAVLHLPATMSVIEVLRRIDAELTDLNVVRDLPNNPPGTKAA